MSIKCTRTELGMTKPVEVKQSNDNMLAAYNFQLKLAKMSTIDEDNEPVQIIEQMLDTTQYVMDFLTDLLKLNVKQQAKLGELETDETIEIANDLAMRLMGMDPEKDVSEEDKEAEKN